jgi:hypothetical protein
LLLLLVCSPAATEAQLRSDTLFTWQGYGRASTCRVRIYQSGADQKKALTVVIGETGENHGASTLDDVQHLVELIGRRLSVDPEEAYWVFHWGGFSHAGAEPSNKELFFRATFRRSDSGALGTPFWRLVNREAVVEYTDRAFR